MKITVPKLITNDQSDFPFIEALVSFWEKNPGENQPHRSIQVTVFLKKQDVPISEVRALAIEEARKFLSEILK